jgi:formylglycine-generating enzyme required for sulfatase activity
MPKPVWLQREFSCYHLSSWDLMPQPFAWMPIPAGQVCLGKTDIEPSDEKFWLGPGYIPKGTTRIESVSAFEIARYPITNAHFALFVEEGGYINPAYWTEVGWAIREEQRWTQPLFWHDATWNKCDYPVVGVSWYEALAFCRWLSDRTNERITLPTEAQWQYAAQGDSRRAVAWDFDTNANDDDLIEWANWGGFGDSSGTTPVTRYEGRNESPFGVVDMTGNVWEWCITDYQTGNHDPEGKRERVAKGGSWQLFISYEINIWLQDRFEGISEQREDYIGFRPVRLA